MTNTRRLCRRGLPVITALVSLVVLAATAEAQGPGRGTPPAPIAAADKLSPIPPGQLEVGGELGRRIRVTIENSLLNLDVDGDFLKPFREKKTGDGYTGLNVPNPFAAELVDDELFVEPKKE